MNWPNPGVHYDVMPEQYFALTEIDGKLVRSNSMLAEFERDPALFHAGHRKAATRSMKRGSLLDCLLTSPHRFGTDFVKSPFKDFRTNEAKAWRNEQTKTVVTEAEVKSAVSTIEKIQSDSRWQEITAGAVKFQVAIRADIKGMPFKCLVDVLPDENGPYGDAIVDVKRCGQMDDLSDVLRSCRSLEYNRQGGLYRGLAKLAGLKGRNRYILFILPQDGPITPCVLELGEQMLANGANAVMRADQKLRDCESTGIWPGRFDGVKRVEQADEEWPWSEVEPELQEA